MRTRIKRLSGVRDGLLVEKDRLLRDEFQTVGDYIVLEELGGGGFGRVVRAYDTERWHDVAIKQLQLKDVPNPQVRERKIESAFTELRAVERVEHPGIAQVWAVGRDEGGFYVVQEFIEGRRLDDAVRKWTKTLAPESLVAKVIFLLKHMAGALQALHAQGVFHRDLKPANVILRKADGCPVIVDMGIAHVTRSGSDDDPFAGFGTLGYMSPEQLRKEPLDGRSDLYALGVIVYEILTGELPIAFPRRASRQQCEEILRKSEIAPLARRCPKASGALSALVMSLLAKSPDGRRKSAQEVANEADRFLAP